MKITDLKMIHIRPRWMFLKIETDEGICGWGEPVVEGRARTVETAVNEFRPMLIGADPLKIEHLWQGMYRRTFYRGGPILCSAISGIEMALWDIKGKYYNMPVFEMLGGAYRDKVRMYGHLKPTGHPGDFPIPDMLKITDKRLADGKCDRCVWKNNGGCSEWRSLSAAPLCVSASAKGSISRSTSTAA